MSKKSFTVEGPPQRSETKAPQPTKPLSGWGYRPRKPTVKDLEELPKAIQGLPRWIYGLELMAHTILSNAALMVLIKEKKLKAYTRDDTIYEPYFDLDSFKDLKFSWADVFELEDQGLLYMGDNEDIQRYRQMFQAWKKGFNNKKPPKEGNEDLSFKEKKLRPNQNHKIEYRKVAESLWEKNPTITITDMCYKDEINEISDPKQYSEKTIRNWIKDLCPNRSPGRRPKK
jgi:hypothetical protein